MLSAGSSRRRFAPWTGKRTRHCRSTSRFERREFESHNRDFGPGRSWWSPRCWMRSKRPKKIWQRCIVPGGTMNSIYGRSNPRCRWATCAARRRSWCGRKSGRTSWPTTSSARSWPKPRPATAWSRGRSASKGQFRPWKPFSHCWSLEPRRMPPHRLRLYHHLLDAIATHRVADRPDRYEPRLKKRRRNHYDWLTKPRAEIKRAMAKGVTKN